MVRSTAKLHDSVYRELLVPSDKKLAKKIVLECPRFMLVDRVLYYVNSMHGNNLRIAVPASAKQKQEEAHTGSMGGHFTP